MAGLRRVNGLLSVFFTEKRLFIQSGDATRYLRFTPLSQLMTGIAGLGLVSWVAIATATISIQLLDPNDGPDHAVVLQTAYETRLEDNHHVASRASAPWTWLSPIT